MPVPIEKAVGRTGEFLVTFSHRSPLSLPADVAKRTSINPIKGVNDYDLPRESFQIYVPKTPAPDGKYGLMDVLPFPGHAHPPHGWDQVLEKYHLIWIADPAGGNGRPTLQRIGLVLDAAYNVRKTWPIDGRRVYDLITGVSPAAGVGLYYPDVFRGTIFALYWPWYAKITDPVRRIIWRTNSIVRPAAPQLDQDRAHRRFVGISDEAPPLVKGIDPQEVVFERGWSQAGFKYLKWLKVPEQEIHRSSTWSPEWFDRAVAYLDEAPATRPAVAQGHGAAPENKPAGSESKAAGPETKPAVSAAQRAGQASPGAEPQDKPKAAPDPAEQAAHALSLAKSYLAAQLYDRARTRLKHIVDTYPGTPAADEAKSLLQQIQDK